MSRRAKITKRAIDAIVPPASGEINLWDSEVPGFGLRVRYTGSRVYVVEYRNRAQRKRRVTLGPHGRLTVDQARDLARQILAAVARGEDPAQERQEDRSAPTFVELATRYLEQHAALKKKPSSTAADKRVLRQYLLPVLGARKVAEIGLRDIADLHNAIRSKPVQANRTLAVL